MARSCVFCGGRPLTREHVMTRWLTSVLAEQAAFRGQDQQIVLQPDGRNGFRLMLPHREMKESFNSLTVKAVCRICNSGWMNDIETMARPVLSPLIRGESRQLQRSDVLAIASWTVKTALMTQLTGVEGIAALAPVYQLLYHEREPSQNSVVWAAATGSEDWALRCETVGALIGTEDEPVTVDASEPVNTVSTTIGLGNLLLHTVFTARSSVSYPPLDEIHQGAVVQLWPNPDATTLLPTHWLFGEVAWMISRSLAFRHSAT